MWVKFERSEDDVYVTVCQETDFMVTVWVRERGDMFCRGLIFNIIVWQEITEQSGTVAEVIYAVAVLDEEAREAVSRGKLGWDFNGL